MAVEAENDSMGPDGISPTLAVYGSIPRFGQLRDQPSPPIHQKAITVKNPQQL